MAPPPAVSTVHDLLRHPTDTLLQIEAALGLRHVLRPVIEQALAQRGEWPLRSSK